MEMTKLLFIEVVIGSRMGEGEGAGVVVWGWGGGVGLKTMPFMCKDQISTMFVFLG